MSPVVSGNSTSLVSCLSSEKEQGMSGGQQNKDEEVVKMVARMNELKEKQDPVHRRRVASRRASVHHLS